MFSILIGYLCIFLAKYWFKCVFLNWVVYVSVEMKVMFLYYEYKFFIWYVIWWYFIPWCGLSFNFWIGSFNEQKFLIFMKCNLTLLVLGIVLLFFPLTNLCLTSGINNFLCFLWSYFIVLGFTFRPVFHFVNYGVKDEVFFHFLKNFIQFLFYFIF